MCATITKKHRFQANAYSFIKTDSQPVTLNGVAFFAYLSRDEPNPSTHKTFIFDVDHTNIGGHYSHHTGVFTSPSHGVYIFSWSIYCIAGGVMLVVNSSPVSGKYVGAQSVNNLLLNDGDKVYIRTPLNYASSGFVRSDALFRSSFIGWKLF